MGSLDVIEVEGLGDVLYPENGDGPNYPLPKTWHSQKTKIRVACVGAGPSGLCLAYKMERQMESGTWELAVYEKNAAEGGTWYENRYPGCACDIPAHIYTYSWDPQPHWSSFYAYAPEILEYFKKFSDKHDLHHYVQLNSQIVSAIWNDQAGIYKLIIKNPQTGEQREDWSHVLVNASGNLNKWKWPEIEGLHDFAGSKMHSATWDESVDFKGKTVAAIQIVPALQKVAKKLELFMRSPTWISPPFGGGVLKEDVRDGKEDMAHRQYFFSEEEKQKFADDPEHHLLLRQKIEAEINLLFPFYTRGTPLQKKMHLQMRSEMEKRLGPGHDELKNSLIPEWLPGCRRVTPGDGYLESLVKPNVNCIFQGIQKIVSDGLIDEAGKLHRVDIIVCATGFDVPYIPHFQVINADGINMQNAWSEQPNLYMGITAPKYPNYFVAIGPGGTWANGTILPALETSCEHFIKMFNKMQSEGIKSLEVTQDACDDLMYHMNKFHENTVWGDSCRSWYKKNGKVWVWPGATIHYAKTLNEGPRYEDYKFTYWRGRRFAYLGDGTVKAMHTRDVKQLAPYLRNADTPWFVE